MNNSSMDCISSNTVKELQGKVLSISIGTEDLVTHLGNVRLFNSTCEGVGVEH